MSVVWSSGAVPTLSPPYDTSGASTLLVSPIISGLPASSEKIVSGLPLTPMSDVSIAGAILDIRSWNFSFVVLSWSILNLSDAWALLMRLKFELCFSSSLGFKKFFMMSPSW